MGKVQRAAGFLQPIERTVSHLFGIEARSFKTVLNPAVALAALKKTAALSVNIPRALKNPARAFVWRRRRSASMPRAVTGDCTSLSRCADTKLFERDGQTVCPRSRVR